MEGQSAAEALRQLEAMRLPNTPKIAGLRKGLLAEVRLVTEYPQYFERLESQHAFTEQFERRSEILRSAGLTTDINGNAITYPSYDDIREAMLERPELFAKMNQGFVRLQPVPIGAPLEAYFTALEDGLRQYAREGALRATDGTPGTVRDLSRVQQWLHYDDDDVNGTIVYEPVRYTKENHGGRTKAQLIEQSGAMQVLLTEDLRKIPCEGMGTTIGGRRQIEAGKIPAGYLELLGKEPYALESGYTLEAQLAHMLTHLHETEGEVIDRPRLQRLPPPRTGFRLEEEPGTYCIGTWSPAQETIPAATCAGMFLSMCGMWHHGPFSIRTGIRIV